MQPIGAEYGIGEDDICNWVDVERSRFVYERRLRRRTMDEAQIDLDVHVGVTLRSLLENRELVNSQDNCVNGRIQDNIEHRMRYSERLNDNYICAAKRNEKEDKEEENGNFDSSAAFLGPTLWDKSDFKLEYVDLDEFLCENGMPHEENQKLDHIVRENTNASQNSHHHHHHHHQHPQQPQQPHTHSDYRNPHHHHPTIHYNQNHDDRKQEKQICESSPESQEDEQHANDEEELPVECKFTDDDLALATVPGHNNFDPTIQVFSEDELKPQPMVKKSRKHFVPDNMKDEKYWMRRHKNNIAAKRSREARRVKENQIVLRASYLEKENHVLREELEKLRGENKMLRQCLKKYEQ